MNTKTQKRKTVYDDIVKTTYSHYRDADTLLIDFSGKQHNYTFTIDADSIDKLEATIKEWRMFCNILNKQRELLRNP